MRSKTASESALEEIGTTTGKEILVTFVVPCYNASAYMDNCILSILQGSANHQQHIEIIIVDDGSDADDTAVKADDWQNKYPTIIRAYHQSNGGHGEAVNTGLKHARGMYFKVVDADDWLDEKSLPVVLNHLLLLSLSGLDLFITNYVYEKPGIGKRKLIRFNNVMEEARILGWDDIGNFKPQQNLVMHAVIYRTELLRMSNLVLPAHTFYVDNIFVYVPLPYVQTIYYLNCDLYRYFIGRDNQSVNEQTMVKRVDQQLFITRIMIDAYRLNEEIQNKVLRDYMTHYLTMMMTICVVFLRLSKAQDAEKQRIDLWIYLKEKDPKSYLQIRGALLSLLTNIPGKPGKWVCLKGYRFARSIFKFN